MTPVAYPNQPLANPSIDRVGRAWQLSFDPDQTADSNIGAAWLVQDNSRDRHPDIWWYLVTGTHLRGDPERLFTANATHEVLVLALPPNHALCDVKCWRGGEVLMPPAISRWFLARTDRQAAILVAQVVRHICDGHSPHLEAGYWSEFIDRTAEHAYYGCHPALN